MKRDREVEAMTDEELIGICRMVLQAALDHDVLPRDV